MEGGAGRSGGGIAGGPLDKSWLILRAYAAQEYGMDLAAETEQVFGAPPLIYKTALQGETDAAINFWHFLAKMTAGGMRDLVTVSDAAAALGLDPGIPLLGYVLKGDFVAKNPEVAAGLVRASRSAKTLLAEEDAAWEPLREMMNAADDAEFEALRAGFRAGIPAGDNVDPVAADAFLGLMAELGGEELVGTATTLPEGLFVSVGE
jgi:NitT/TauT family transport system substrate-binding protein